MTDVLKGSVPATHVIKQIGGNLPEGGMNYRVPGVPTFAVGENYVVLLAGVSSAGFSSPIGLGQGKFTVQNDAVGQSVTNGRDFREMTAGISAALLPGTLRGAAAPLRHLGLDEFKQLVRARAAVAQ